MIGKTQELMHLALFLGCLRKKRATSLALRKMKTCCCNLRIVELVMQETLHRFFIKMHGENLRRARERSALLEQ